MIQFSRGTQTQLNSSSQVFAAGQPIFESDSGQLKIGNGSSRYSSLPYVGASSSGQTIAGNINEGHIDFGDVSLYYGHGRLAHTWVSGNVVNTNGSICYTYSYISLTAAYGDLEERPIPVPDNRFQDILAATVYPFDKAIWCYQLYPDGNGIFANFAWSSDFQVNGALFYYYQYWLKNN